MAYFNDLYAYLRQNGFVRDKRSSIARQQCTIYNKKLVCEAKQEVRQLVVQIWRDGQHRVSHYLNERMSTAPTMFANIEGMQEAIALESTRTDQPPRDGCSPEQNAMLNLQGYRRARFSQEKML